MPLVLPLAAAAVADGSATGSDHESPDGLTSEAARRRLDQFGPNAMPDTSSHPARMALEKLWAPIPWMLEAAIVLQVVLGEYVEAGIIAVLLLFNAARPSGTESVYKIYAESFRDEQHLEVIVNEAQGIVNNALSGPGII